MIKSFLHKCLNCLVLRPDKLVYKDDMMNNYELTFVTDKEIYTEVSIQRCDYTVYPEEFSKRFVWLKELQKSRRSKLELAYSVPNCTLVFPHGVAVDEKNKVVMVSVKNRRTYLLKTGMSKYFLRKRERPNWLPGTYISLLDILDFNYYHFLIDVLPRLETYFRLKSEGENVILIARVTKNSFQEQWLRVLNVDFNDILHFSSSLKVEELVMPPMASNKLMLKKSDDFTFLLERNSLSWLREAVHDTVNSDNSKRRVLIIRPQGSDRSFANEKELLDLVFVYGFEPIIIEELSVLEQIKLFVSAECVIAAHGAALTNLIFSTDCFVIELFPENRYVDSASIFYQITQNFENKHVLVATKSEGPKHELLVDINVVSYLITSNAL